MSLTGVTKEAGSFRGSEPPQTGENSSTAIRKNFLWAAWCKAWEVLQARSRYTSEEKRWGEIARVAFRDLAASALARRAGANTWQ
jgi:hypothetical protein